MRDADLARLLTLGSRVTDGVNEAMARTIGPDLTSNRMVRILLMVHFEGGVLPSQLADRLGVSRSLASRSISRLVEANLVKRTDAPGDGRARRIVLTRKGRRALDRFEQALGEFFTHESPLLKEIVPIARVSEATGSQTRLSPLVVAERLAEAGERFVSAVNRALVRYGIDQFTERRSIMYLDEYGPTQPSILAMELGLSRQGTTELLDRLEEAGLVRRRKPPGMADRRAVHVALTVRGRAAARAITKVIRANAETLVDAFVLAYQCGAALDR